MQLSLLKLIAFLGFALILASCERISTAPKIDRVVDDVGGFDLVLADSSGRAPFGLFEVGYAIKSNYAYFTYRSMRYTSVGGGSVLIQPVAKSPAQYEVDLTRFNRHLIRSKLKRRASHEESQLHSRIQG